jgi:hypothetical protein
MLMNPLGSKAAAGTKKKFTRQLKSWAYAFDGSFYRHSNVINITVKTESTSPEVSTTKLDAYSFRFASGETRPLLQARGKTFWTCRNKNLVAYHDKSGKYGVSHSHQRRLCVPFGSLNVERRAIYDRLRHL